MVIRLDQPSINGESTRSMLDVRTFGGLTLRLDGKPITGVVTQRRQLALLALLAVAGEEGMSRDKLLAYLWPEKDTESARHILNQLLYAQRLNAGDGGLFLGRKTLRLNPELIESDVQQFEQELAADRLESAIALYRGPFLDGFHLSGGQEFEQWVEGQRKMFARKYAECLEELARRAEALGNPAEALRWLGRRQEADPLDATATVRLAEALIQRGDRPSARRVLRGHQELIRKHMDIEPDPVVVRLEQDLSSRRV
jgi:serine/threonine-protein kinase